MMECRVLKEIFPKQLMKRYNCRQIIDPNNGKLSYEKAVEKFYHVGAYYKHFNHKLEKHSMQDSFPKVTNDKASFISSAYGMPYPVAAYEEYVSVLNKVCANDKKRLVYLMKDNEGRSPASNVKKVEEEYQARCGDLNRYN
jgi:hypothetical protein